MLICHDRQLALHCLRSSLIHPRPLTCTLWAVGGVGELDLSLSSLVITLENHGETSTTDGDEISPSSVPK